MCASCRRLGIDRTARFESMESRLLLSADPVADFWIDNVVEDQVTDAVEVSLADAHQLTGLDQVQADYGFVGTGQTVVVIDTGIAYDHIALGEGLGADYRVVGGYDFTEYDADPYDDGPYGSHGTHVAGIIGGDAGSYSGVASGVDLVGLRVFDDNGYGNFSWVEEALQWVHTNQLSFENPITSVNLSLGANWNAETLPSWAMLEDEFAQLEADGIFISVAAGNNFTTYNTPGLSYPAVSSHVVPVASVDDSGALSNFSQRVDGILAAPGQGILSAVPDYVGDHDGLSNDYAHYSGTSMAAPYVAGASVLLREAYEFVGITNVDQDMLYELMVSTADTLTDPTTGISYNVLNLERAIDAVMPADDFGSNASTAYNLGSIDTSSSVNGTIERLHDADWFTFTAATDGHVTFAVDTTGELLPQWELQTLSRSYAATSTVESDSLAFDVLAGQSYTIGLATGEGLGHYTLDLNLEASVNSIDWGTVEQQWFTDYEIAGSGQQFAATAATDGLLTFEALFNHNDGDVDLQVFDAAGQLLGGSYSSADMERIDVVATAGETYYLQATVYGGGTNASVDFRVTNLVSQDGSTVHVRGTEADDVFSFTAGASHLVTVGGVTYQFDASEVQTVAFEGRGGTDHFDLQGTNAAENAILRVGSAEVTGSGYQVTATEVESITLRAGGGQDTATFYDSAGDDTFVSAVGYGGMFTSEGTLEAYGVEQVSAYAQGGHDVAKLYDSAGDDTFVATAGYASISGSGQTSEVRGFDAVHAFATAGGNDVAKFYDSPGNDTFDANPVQSALYGPGFFNRAKFFEQVHAFASSSGTDIARLYDSAGDDVFAGNGVSSILWGTGFYNRAKFFEQVHLYGTAGGNDISYLYDSEGDDHLEASSGQAQLIAAGSVTWLYDFEYLRAEATHGGVDKAEIAAVDFVLELDGAWS